MLRVVLRGLALLCLLGLFSCSGSFASFASFDSFSMLSAGTGYPGGLLTLHSAEAARQIEVKPTPQLPQVIVRENFIQQAEKRIAEEMAAAGDSRRYTVEAVRVPAGLRLPWGKITYSCTLPNGVRKSLLTAVNVDVLLDGKPYDRKVCSMRVRIYENVVVAATRIQKETPLKAENLMIAEREDTGKNFERYTDKAQLIGKVLSVNASEGTLLHSGMVREEILIEPFTQVNICSNVNGIVIKTMGTALERGRRNGYITVQNDSSKRRLRARVIDENTVEVVQ